MKGKFKKSFFLLFVIAIIAMVSGYMMWNKPHKNVKDSNAIKITAIDLYKIFITDSIKARSKYLNAIVLVSGEVEKVFRNQQNQQVILLKTNTRGSSVNCTLEENINNIKTGDSILVKGICSGYISGDDDMKLPGDVFLIRCYCSIIKPGL
jgi:hypothetical protein